MATSPTAGIVFFSLHSPSGRGRWAELEIRVSLGEEPVTAMAGEYHVGYWLAGRGFNVALVRGL